MNYEARKVLNNFKPRDYQLPIVDALENKGYKKILAILPRRAGKDIVAWNLSLRQCIKKKCTVFYIFPTYSQAKKVIWSSITNEGLSFHDFIPRELVASKNSQEMKIEFTNGSILQLIGSDNIDCFDDKTEILTENGWKLFKNLDKSEKVATLKDGYLEYDYPTHYVAKPYNGVMYHGYNTSIDFMVTPTHRFYVKSQKGFWKFKTINDISPTGDCVPSTCLWRGNKQEEFEFPVVTSSWHTGKGRLCEKVYNRKINMSDFVAVLGIYLAEGSTYKDYKTYRTVISQKKVHIRKHIEELLDNCNIKYRVNGFNYTIDDRQIYEYFSQFGKQVDRFIPKEIKNLSVEYLEILFKWLILGDGNVQGNQIKFYSSSKTLIDDMQEIAIKLGYSANVSIKSKKGDKSWFARDNRFIEYRNDLWQILIRKSKFKRFASSKKNYISQKEYNGIIYCVSVPSGIIKVRRNGKEIWSGNSIVGTNPYGCVFSEYALQDPKAYQFIRPILAANDGWALFISTPRGKNNFWELYNIALNHPEWFAYKLTLDDTRHIPLKEIEREREEGIMSEDLIQQEYYTSFSLGVEGAYYTKYIDKMRISGQIGHVPYEYGFPVHTAWDLGVRDTTTILFFQTIGQTVRIIDCYENSKEGLEHYVKVINQKDYIYGRHIAPHDIKVKEFGSGMTRIEKAKQLGIKFIVAPSISIEDGIESVRSAFSKIWIDEEKCVSFLKAVNNYRQEYDSKKKVYKDRPLHDYSSHFCDALRYLCITLPKTRDGLSAEELDQRYRDAMYGQNGNLPEFFR